MKTSCFFDKHIRKSIQDDLLRFCNENNVKTPLEYVCCKFTIEHIMLDVAYKTDCKSDIDNFIYSPLNTTKLEIKDGDWEILLIKHDEVSELYYAEPIMRTEKILVFVCEKYTGFWTTNSQLLFKELNVLPENPYKNIKGWQNERELWDMYINHKINLVYN